MKTIEQIRDELAEEFSKGFDDPIGIKFTYTAGFDKRGEIDREEIERHYNAMNGYLEKAARSAKEIEKLKRVIEAQRYLIVKVGQLSQEEWLRKHADSTLKEADAIMNGEKK